MANGSEALAMVAREETLEAWKTLGCDETKWELEIISDPDLFGWLLASRRVFYALSDHILPNLLLTVYQRDVYRLSQQQKLLALGSEEWYKRYIYTLQELVETIASTEGNQEWKAVARRVIPWLNRLLRIPEENLRLIREENPWV